MVNISNYYKLDKYDPPGLTNYENALLTFVEYYTSGDNIGKAMLDKPFGLDSTQPWPERNEGMFAMCNSGSEWAPPGSDGTCNQWKAGTTRFNIIKSKNNEDWNKPPLASHAYRDVFKNWFFFISLVDK